MVHSFLLIGQSNMAGRGYPHEVAPITGDHLKVLRNGRWIPMSVPVNYDRAYAGVNLAKRTSTIAGVLWHQGESDCTKGLYPSYAEHFQKFYEDLRTDLELQDVPFLVGGLGDYMKESEYENEHLYYERINDQLRIIEERNPLVGFVPAEGLASNPDRQHFSSKGLWKFGLRYYEVFKRLENQEKKFEEKDLADAALRTHIETI